MDDRYTAEDVIKLTKNIYKVDSGDGRGNQISSIQKKTDDILKAIKVDILRKN